MGALAFVVGFLIAPEAAKRFVAFLNSGLIGKFADVMLTLALVIPATPC